MTAHRMTVVNGVYPGFGGPTMTTDRARRIARLIPAGTDIVATCETGSLGCARIAGALGQHWAYQRAQGPPGTREGLNGIFWDTRVWDWPDERMHDWTLPSGGQWPRTLILVRLTEKADPTAFVWAGAFHLSAKGSPLTALQADAVKLVQSHELARLIGERRVLIGGDFPRTGDDDDMAYLYRQGLLFNGRTDKTPLVSIRQGAVTVTKTRLVDPGRLLDHHIHVTDFTVAGKPATPTT